MTVKAAIRKASSSSVVEPTTGKVLVEKTVTVKCRWKDPDTGKECGAERLIKPQDQFQVKFCVPHQRVHYLKMRSERARTARKRSASGAGKTTRGARQKVTA